VAGGRVVVSALIDRHRPRSVRVLGSKVIDSHRAPCTCATSRARRSTSSPQVFTLTWRTPRRRTPHSGARRARLRRCASASANIRPPTRTPRPIPTRSPNTRPDELGSRRQLKRHGFIDGVERVMPKGHIVFRGRRVGVGRRVADAHRTMEQQDMDDHAQPERQPRKNPS